jgi:hypothetical protein
MTDRELIERILDKARLISSNRGLSWTIDAYALADSILEWVRRRPELGYQERIAELEAEVDRLKRQPEAVKKWTEEKNKRRSGLIDKEIDGTITPEEKSELEQLQSEMLEYRRRVAPRPMPLHTQEED